MSVADFKGGGGKDGYFLPCIAIIIIVGKQ